MSETLTTAEAARLVAEARRWEGSLRQRTEGITWMVWGIATAAMFLSYEVVGATEAPGWVFAVLWIPWVLAGNLTSYALWRSAALTRDPEVTPIATRRYLRLILVFVVVFALMGFILRPTRWSIFVPMLVAGVLWAFLGFLIPRMSRQGRIVSAVIGSGVVVAALVISILPQSYADVLAIVAIGAIALAGGLWQTLRA